MIEFYLWMIRWGKKEREHKKSNEGHPLLYANEIKWVRLTVRKSTTNGGWVRKKNKFFYIFEEEPRILGGESANAVSHYHKLCSRVSHIWGNRRLQRHLSAMVESRPEGTALLITVSFEPGKYAFWGSFLWLIKIIASKTINHALSKMNNPKMKFG